MNKTPYLIFPTINSEKLLLRQVLKTDLKSIISISFYDGQPAKTEEEAAVMQTYIDKDYENGDSIHWVIVDKNIDVIVGTCGYYRGFVGGVGELGCVLKPEYRSKGYMTAALQLVIQYGFEIMLLKKITASTTKENIKAQQLLKRLNFLEEKNIDDETLLYEYF